MSRWSKKANSHKISQNISNFVKMILLRAFFLWMKWVLFKNLVESCQFFFNKINSKDNKIKVGRHLDLPNGTKSEIQLISDTTPTEVDENVIIRANQMKIETCLDASANSYDLIWYSSTTACWNFCFLS